ncbi:MAG TPA: hypothetical protein VNA11_20505 [Pseudonocardia sp.]|nr:hypothetical protein [Pseudonocardia sp.]
MPRPYDVDAGTVELAGIDVLLLIDGRHAYLHRTQFALAPS